MAKFKKLYINGVLLEQNQLENYMQKIASDHIVRNKSNKITYPIPRVKENYNYIKMVYKLLSEHVKLGIIIHPAGEWLLDNFYIIEKTVKTVIKDMPLKKYLDFPSIASGTYEGFARIYVLSSEIVGYTDAKIDDDILLKILTSYQMKNNLNMEEIWSLGTFLQIALIENIRMICERIYSAQIQKYKVENIIERLIENKNEDKLKYKNLPSYKTKILGYREMKYPFIEYMSFRLKNYGKQAYSFLKVLEEQIDMIGTNINDVIKKEHFNMASKKVSIGNSIISINNLSRINFLQIFENINSVEEILNQDPANVYEFMDYKTKIYYRNIIKEISKKTKISEIFIAKKCLNLAKSAQKPYDNKKEIKRTHVGYYLIDDGKDELLYELTKKTVKKMKNETKSKMYIIIIFAFTLAVDILISNILYNQSKNIIISVLFFILMFIPAINEVTHIIQYILSKIVKSKIIPKMDFSKSIPAECTTMVIIPTIVKSKEKVEEVMKKLEVYYLANKNKNIYFTLLGDCSQSTRENESFDSDVENAGISMVSYLNEKYKNNDDMQIFNFIYRKRLWNEKESCFLGWERKRGYINEFNKYILGKTKNEFKINTIEDWKIRENKDIPKVKYIITLDSDTDLTLNSGIELIGAMAHILNKPVISNSENIVIDGHGIIQPRVGISLTASRKSEFTKIFAGNSGTDSYTNAISDVYQDNFSEGIFTGKGIYDVEVFEKVLDGEIPENTVLSHDLLEGSYLRCALSSDILLMDGYPTSYLSFKTRLHRWIRGDFQILPWLFKKRLNTLSKYKILDNIFRSQFEVFSISTIIFLLLISIFSNVKVWRYMLVILVILIMPLILDIINKIIFKKDGKKAPSMFTKSISRIKGKFYKSCFKYISFAR